MVHSSSRSCAGMLARCSRPASRAVTASTTTAAAAAATTMTAVTAATARTAAQHVHARPIHVATWATHVPRDVLQLPSRQQQQLQLQLQRPCAAPIRSRPRRGIRGVRHFHATPRDANITERLGDMARQAMRRTVAPYSAFGATREMYQKCTQPAAYSISEEARRTDNVPTTEDGEEIGVGGGLWHDEFNLLASFSTWSQVTMLHMYLLVTRLRCFDKETYQMWQSMLSDHFFQEAEDKMDVVHHITSRGLRQRHLQDLFMAWRGVIVAYDEGLVRGDAVLAAALWRNLFKARPDVDLRHLAAVVSWMRRSVSRLGQMPDESVLLRSASGIFSWPSPDADLALVDRPATQELRALLQQHKENASTSAQGAPAENEVPEANGKEQLAAA